jgi:hypothetical protein
MSRPVYSFPYHSRQGQFGKAEQHRQRKFNDYLADLKLYAEGFLTPVTTFTRRKSGIIDTELIKEAVSSMLEPFPYQGDEREYYYSFLYCAMALLSVEYEYTTLDAVGTILSYEFPSGMSSPTFKDLAADADLVQGMDGSYGFESFSLYANQFCELYYLLTEMTIDFPEADFSPDEDTAAEILQEIQAETNPDQLSLDEMYSNLPENAGTSEDVREANLLSGGKVKLMYPGYQDYITGLDRFVSLFDTYQSTDFFETIREIISTFLSANGCSLFSKEEDYFEAMVSLAKARNTIQKTMR